MSSANIPHLAIARAESIALLHLLHSVPAPPSSNQHDSTLPDQNYSLPFWKERDLTSTLAFLSCTADDPNRIPAVCIRQDIAAASINVLIAVNKHRANDGSATLRGLKESFEVIFAILSRVSSRDPRPDIENEVFTAIVAMCSHRILCRLRLVSNARKISKQPVSEILQNAIRCFDQLGKKKLGTLQNPTAFVEHAKRVIQLIGLWNKHQTMHELRELIEGVYYLQKAGDLERLLPTIPNRMMDPSSRKNLINIVSKVARYREAAQFLYRTARKYALVRRMKIVIADLPESFFYMAPVSFDTPNLATKLKTIDPVYRKSQINYICNLLNTTQSQANETIATQMTKTMTEAKIHAEIQLLYYCEVNELRPTPRVICSSKDACYLCNAFITAHGKMHMPGYHGRLYPGWRLPLCSALKATELKLNDALENTLRHSLYNIVSKRRKTVYPDPNESTLLTLAASTSTLRISLLSRATRRDLEAVQTLSHDDVVQGDSAETSSISTVKAPVEQVQIAGCATNDMCVTIDEEANAESLPVNETAPEVLPGYSHSCRAMPLGHDDDDVVALVQGQPLLCTIAAGNISPFYSTGSLETQIEYPIEEAQMRSNCTPKDVGYDLEWVVDREAGRRYEHLAAPIIDAEGLEGESTYELDDSELCFLRSSWRFDKVEDATGRCWIVRVMVFVNERP